MQRLLELGFQFEPRGGYTSWNDRMDELKKFREQHGHCKIPVNDPVLGDFVKLARRDYKLWKLGRPCGMTPEREQQLKEVDFVFEGGKTPERREPRIKSWDERFEDLKMYKEEHGHTVVPQNAGRLGGWVHCQRVNFKKLMAGKQTPLTAEKALKLTNIGFCLNASDKFRGTKPEQHQQHQIQQHAQQHEQHLQMFQQNNIQQTLHEQQPLPPIMMQTDVQQDDMQQSYQPAVQETMHHTFQQSAQQAVQQDLPPQVNTHILDLPPF